MSGGFPAEGRKETLRLLSDEGTSLIDRMYDRISTLKSRNDTLLGLLLAVISAAIAVMFYAIDNNWFPSWHILFLGLVYFMPAFIAAYKCIRMVIPKEYSELTVYYDRDYAIVSNADTMAALGHIVHSKKVVFDKLAAKYSEDLAIHKASVGWFLGSFFGLFIFALMELFYVLDSFGG